MSRNARTTRQVVKRHMSALVLNLGLPALLANYDDHAVFITANRLYRGKTEIRDYLASLIAGLRLDLRRYFRLHALRSHQDLAYVVWSVDGQIPLGTDTFIVRRSRIVQHTFAMFTTR